MKHNLKTSLLTKALRQISLSSTFSVLCLTAAFSQSAQAQNLLQIYQISLENDPVIRAAEATYKANSENKALGRSALLPQIVATASIGSQETEIEQVRTPGVTTDGTTETGFGDSTVWGVSLNQAIVDMSKWFSFKQGKFLNEQAEAQFALDQQDLILRVVQSYFNVLRAEDNLSSSQAEERANKQRLEQTQQRFDVGLIAITDVHEAQASYDQTVVNRLTDEAALGTALERLGLLTGQQHENLWKLREDFNTLTPEPEDRAAWVEFSLQHNNALKASRSAMFASEQNSKSKKADHFPTLSGNISYNSYDVESEFDGSPLPFDETSESTDLSVTLNLNWPLYTGGFVSASRRQALEQFNAARENLTATERNTVQTVRALHLNIMTTIARVKANKQSIVSAQSALESTEAGYQVGTRNIVDVLEAQEVLFQAQKNYSNSKYDYIQQMVSLKKEAGLLSPQDIEQLNAALENRL